MNFRRINYHRDGHEVAGGGGGGGGRGETVVVYQFQRPNKKHPKSSFFPTLHPKLVVISQHNE